MLHRLWSITYGPTLVMIVTTLVMIVFSLVITATKLTKEDKRKKKGNIIGPLVRPIICICNDPYVPALRELREHTLILYFNGIDRSRLTSRLEDVCKLNHVKVDRSALTKLATKTEDDIRSCINALQFLSMNNNNKAVTITDIDKVKVQGF